MTVATFRSPARRTGRLRLTCAALVLAAALAAPRAAAAQFGYFGQNKVQYRDFDWRTIKGPHVDVYFYPAEERIARMALAYAEQSYDTLSRRFNHVVSRRIPLIVYASHYDFEQTNVLPFLPPEDVLGVTEYLKRRVTIPFRGSYAEFRHTIRHELVHVFQLSLLTQQFELYPRARGPGTPLWWSEGLAEYFSSTQDSRDEMIVRDLTLSNEMPSISRLNFVESPIVYPLGGELFRFLGQHYGDWRINLMYRTLWKYQTFDDALRGVYGRSAERLTTEWHYDLRQRYFPGVAGRRPAEVAGRAIAEVAIKPVAISRGDSSPELAYLSPRTGYTNIYATQVDGRSRDRLLVAGERTPEFESFHAFSSRMDARNGILVFASKFGDRDALFFWDVAKDKVVGRYQFDSLAGIASPAFAPDGKRIAFSGLTLGGVSDIYLLDTRSGTLTRVTNDLYEDSDPDWLPDGGSLVFSSDRAVDGVDGAKNLFRVRLADGSLSPLTSGDWLDETPRWDASLGRILFSSDRDGTFNLYSVDTLGNGRRETRLDGGAFDPAPIPGDARVAITGFEGLSWSIFTLPLDSAAHTDTFALAAHDSIGQWVWRETTDSIAARATAAHYAEHFSLDFAAGGGSTAPGLYNSQGAEFYFSDLLGDRSLVTSLAFYGTGSVSDLFSNLNADVLYLNQKRRLNWGIGAFRMAGEFFDGDFTQIYTEYSTGGYALVRYPLSKFTRVEAQTRLEYSSRDDFGNDVVSGPERRHGVLTSNYVAIVGDNTLWLETGPIDGARYSLTGGVVSDASHGTFEDWIGVLDARKYVRTTLQSAFAFRSFGYVSEGVRPRATTIGGMWLLRGYPRFTQDGTRAWVLNNEWRFPIANFIALGFPFGALRFPSVQGAFFADAGQAWYKGGYDTRIKGAAGMGFRVPVLPGFVFRLDVGKRFSLRGDPNDGSGTFYRDRFVDFFFGYDY